uniref:Protein kinase domain-containing protein n=1 Tax=Populus trichocarpa TaxID=3694 RepID=A0A2K1Y5Y5_POPTR
MVKEEWEDISDSGLAWIFGGKQTEDRTQRGVVTWTSELANPMHTFLSCSGYMSPEYALDGVFLIKGDDVFSFGLVVLGTLHGGCGKRKRYCMDRELCETCDANEFVRCVNGGLLCVQEHPWDRSTLSNIVFMLGSETASLLTQQDLQ